MDMKATTAVTKFVDRINWTRSVLGVIRSMVKGKKFTSDEVRSIAVSRGISSPPSDNHWGLAVQAARRFFLARKTGEYRPTARAAGHRRVIAVWVRI